MSDYTVDTIESENFTAEILYDTDCGCPFVEWDQVGMIVNNPHRREQFTDSKEGSWPEALGAYYRVGISISDYGSSGYGISWERITPGFRPQTFTDDNGYSISDLHKYEMVCYTTRKRAEEMHSKNATSEQIWEALESELEVWRQWMNGECYGVIVRDQKGKTVESCWGFLGYDDYEEPAREMLKEAEDQHAHIQARLAVTGGWVHI